MVHSLWTVGVTAETHFSGSVMTEVLQDINTVVLLDILPVLYVKCLRKKEGGKFNMPNGVGLTSKVVHCISLISSSLHFKAVYVCYQISHNSV